MKINNNIPTTKSVIFNENKMYCVDDFVTIEIGTNYNTTQLAVDGKVMDIIKSLGEVDLEFKEKQLWIRQGKNLCKTSYIDKYFNFEIPAAEGSIVVTKKDLELALKFCDIRGRQPILRGINISSDGIAASDSYKIFLKGTQAEINYTLDYDFVVQLVKMMNVATTLEFNEFKVWATIDDNTKIYGRLLGEKYPEVMRIFEGRMNNSLNLKPHEIEDAYKLARFGDESYVDMEMREGKLFIKNELIDCEIKPIDREILPRFALEIISLMFLFPEATIYDNGELSPLSLRENDYRVM